MGGNIEDRGERGDDRKKKGKVREREIEYRETDRDQPPF